MKTLNVLLTFVSPPGDLEKRSKHMPSGLAALAFLVLTTIVPYRHITFSAVIAALFSITMWAGLYVYVQIQELTM